MLGRGFVERYLELSRVKDSFLCVGVDPATEDMRDKYTVPRKLIEEKGGRFFFLHTCHSYGVQKENIIFSM